MLPEINRSAIRVSPRGPMLDWINGLDETQQFTLADLSFDVYLIGDVLDDEDFDNELKKNALRIFENELDGWWTDDADWPTNRNYKLFREWFDVELFEMVWDLETSKIEKM